MVKIADVLYSLLQEFNKICPNIKNVLDDSMENTDPMFLHYINLILNKKLNTFHKQVILDVHTVYIQKKIGDMTSTLEHNLEIYDKLQGFLSNGKLTVLDRVVNFDFETKDVDKLLGFTITFKFLDNIINPCWDESQARELMEKIYINREEI